MGGMGSGPSSGFGRTTVEQSLTLGINELVRDGAVQAHCHTRGTRLWSYVSTGKHIASISYETNATDPENAWMRLQHRHGDQNEDYIVRLVTTRPTYGGRRWWFLCPATGRRVAKLHLPPRGDIFASRRAYGLAYQSQRERAWERGLTRTQDIRRKLGGSGSMADPFPSKPRHMHWRTYWRLWDEAERAWSICARSLVQRFNMDL